VRCQTAIEIDTEVRSIIMDAYERAKDLLRSDLTVLHKMAEVLLEREVLDGTEIDDIIKRFGNGNAVMNEPQTAAEAVS